MKKITLFLLMILGGVLMSNVIDEEGEGKRDVNGLKQGHWVYRGKHVKVDCFKPEQVVREGDFKDDRRNGQWKEFYCNGELKVVGNWEMGYPKGEFSTYYENGVVKEKGQSTGTRYVGEHIRYAKNGQEISRKTYNADGKPEGKVVERYPNGNIKVEYVAGPNGKPVGVWKHYAENGELKREMVFGENGKILSKKEHEVQETTQEATPVSSMEGPKLEGKLQDGSQPKCDGVQKIYNDNLDIVQDGTFKNCYLFDGKHYIYDADGLLVRIEVYKSGKRHSVENK